MNADAFRHYYSYHFAENRKIWDAYIPSLSQEQFTQIVSYSHGSVRNQIVHLISVDDTWFSALRGLEIPETLDPADFDDRKIIRRRWDDLEQNMRALSGAIARRYVVRKTVPGGRRQRSDPVAGASPCSQSWHRSSRPNSQIAERFGSQNRPSRLHFLRL